MKKVLAAISTILVFAASGATNSTAAAHRHGQVYYVKGHHPFVVQPTIGKDGKATFDHPELELAKLKQRAESKNDAEAMFQQGLVELYGVSGDPNVKRSPNFAEAMRWLRLAASRKHAGANYEISVVLSKYPDLAKPLSPYEQEDCMRAAYNGGDPLAKALVEHTFREAKRLAAEGNPDAKWHLFLALSEGQGCPKDTAAAKRLFDELKAEKNPHCMAFIANKGRRGNNK